MLTAQYKFSLPLNLQSDINSIIFYTMEMFAFSLVAYFSPAKFGEFDIGIHNNTFHEVE